MGFVDELKWRGILHDVMPGTDDLLNKGMVTGYIGFDPTADSLHVGHMMQVMTLLHFQKAGHKPVALVGGATGMVGDPTGKSTERSLLTPEEVNYNLQCIKKQLEKFLDFDCGNNSAVVVNNYDWFKEFSFLDFIRDVGKFITVNYMMAKDSVKLRMDAEGEGMSFTEFCYQLIQGYDFYYLWEKMGAQIQMGGSDQWGNIVTGTELIRKKGRGEAFALTTKLLMKADGTKFGKTESGAVWLDPKKTSPFKFYQFWINCSDEQSVDLVHRFSLKTREEIEALKEQHQQNPGARILQKIIADEMTERVHSSSALQRAKETTDILFGTSFDKFKELSGQEIEEAFDADATFKVSKDVFTDGIDALTLVGDKAAIFKSKGDARKIITGNGVSVNKEKVTLEHKLVTTDLLHGKYLLVQKGKKEYFLFVAE